MPLSMRWSNQSYLACLCKVPEQGQEGFKIETCLKINPANLKLKERARMRAQMPQAMTLMLCGSMLSLPELVRFT